MLSQNLADFDGTNLTLLQYFLQLSCYCAFSLIAHIRMPNSYSVQSVSVPHLRHYKSTMLTPHLSPDHLRNRLQNFKHWGRCRPILFRQGIPTFFLPSILPLLYFLTLTIAAIYFTYPQPLSFIAVAVMGASVWNIYRIDPGIVSTALPILNRGQLMGLRNFCVKCGCFQEGQTHHCQECDVCVSSKLFHSTILHICITPINRTAFCLLWASTIFITSLTYVFSYSQ